MNKPTFYVHAHTDLSNAIMSHDVLSEAKAAARRLAVANRGLVYFVCNSSGDVLAGFSTLANFNRVIGVKK